MQPTSLTTPRPSCRPLLSRQLASWMVARFRSAFPVLRPRQVPGSATVGISTIATCLRTLSIPTRCHPTGTSIGRIRHPNDTIAEPPVSRSHTLPLPATTLAEPTCAWLMARYASSATGSNFRSGRLWAAARQAKLLTSLSDGWFIPQLLCHNGVLMGSVAIVEDQSPFWGFPCSVE